MPLLVFIGNTIVCQSLVVAISVAIEQYVSKWASVVVFGVLYLVAFAVAWRLTVWLIDSRMSAPRNTGRVLAFLLSATQLPMIA